MSENRLKATFKNTTQVDGAINDKPVFFLDTTNQGVLDIEVVSDQAVSLTPGTLVPWQPNRHFDTTGTVFYLFGLDMGFDELEVNGIHVGSGWQMTCYQGQEHPYYLALTPENPINCQGGDHFQIDLSHIVASNGKNKSFCNLRLCYFNVEGITLHHHRYSKYFNFKVLFNPKPHTVEPHLTDVVTVQTVNGIESGVSPRHEIIYVSYSEGDFTPDYAFDFDLEFTPKPGQQPVLMDHTSELILSFVPGSKKFGALASSQDQAGIRVEATESTNGWEITPMMDAKNPYWLIRPGDSHLSGRLHLSNIITHLEPGWCDLYLQYRNVPGYRNWHFTLPILKVESPKLISASLTLRLGPSQVGGRPTISRNTIKYSYQVENTDNVSASVGTLQIFDRNETQVSQQGVMNEHFRDISIPATAEIKTRLSDGREVVIGHVPIKLNTGQGFHGPQV